jgi:hypothetical protein
MTRQIGKLNSQRSQLHEIKSSFDEVINSETMFHYGEWGWDNGTNSPTNYDYQDEYDAYRQESNYTRIILQGMGRSKLEIMNVIKVNYGNKDYIIKEFHQYCEPEKP